MRTLILAAALSLTAVAADAASARDRLVVSPAWLAERIGDRNLVILQVGDAGAYGVGHIPGARLISLADLAAPMSGEALTLELPDPDQLRARLSRLGVSNRSRIVIVPTREAGIQSATRAIFVLDAAGLGDRTVLLEGGTSAWSAEGRALSTEVPTVPPGRLDKFRYRPVVADAAFVRAHAGAPGYKIVDSRATEFYSGSRRGGSAARPHKTGHVAGAVSVPFTTVTTQDLKLASPEEIAARFEAAGVKAGDTIVTYCHIGQQASATLFAARTLGIKVKLYDGSFEEWSRLDGAVE